MNVKCGTSYRRLASWKEFPGSNLIFGFKDKPGDVVRGGAHCGYGKSPGDISTLGAG